jgi:hypothetical protein
LAPDDNPERTSTEETLRQLEDRLSRASEAAERLIAEAARSAEGVFSAPAPRPADPGSSESPESSESPGSPRSPGSPPPAGWQMPGADQDGEHARRSESEIAALIAAVRSLSDLIPPELQRRLAEAVRELLLAVRALIDWYLERLERRRAAPVEVEDIPIL